MKSLKPSSYFFAVVTAALLSGCGSSGVTANPNTTTQNQDNGVLTPVIDTSTGYGAYPLTFQTVGTSAAIPSAALTTDSILKVKVTVNQATQNQANRYTNYTANYTCATVQVTLQIEQNGTYQNFASVTTGRIAASGSSGCDGSETDETIDFSSYMFPGHGNVKITAQAVTSNANCTAYTNGVGNWPYNYGQVCTANPMQSIYQYHVVNGKLLVQVNGTTL